MRKSANTTREVLSQLTNSSPDQRLDISAFVRAIKDSAELCTKTVAVDILILKDALLQSKFRTIKLQYLQSNTYN